MLDGMVPGCFRTANLVGREVLTDDFGKAEGIFAEFRDLSSVHLDGSTGDGLEQRISTTSHVAFLSARFGRQAPTFRIRSHDLDHMHSSLASEFSRTFADRLGPGRGSPAAGS